MVLLARRSLNLDQVELFRVVLCDGGPCGLWRVLEILIDNRLVVSLRTCVDLVPGL